MPAETMDELVSLCKRRGFIFPGSEVYGGLQGTYDYGPLGVELKNNLKAAWWRSMIYERDDIEGLDSSILTHKLVLRHSGHEATFTDPLVDSRESKKRYRLDHLLKDQTPAVLETLVASLEIENNLSAMVAALLAHDDAGSVLKAARVLEPGENKVGDWTSPRLFNMMFKTTVGPVVNDENYAYLRPETAQGIFVNFKNVVDSTARKLPYFNL